jgi:hypothetical protein
MTRFCSILALFALAIACSIPVRAADPPAELIRNPGFEGGSGPDGNGGGVPFWSPDGAGYQVDRDIHRGGDQAIHCTSVSSSAQMGAHATVTLNQTTTLPILVTGWSRADHVDGAPSPGYSLYIDVIYQDGDHLWGQSASFGTGTHGWQQRRIVLLPPKPIRTLEIYALFRGHIGTAWFDDFSARVLVGAGLFDGQPLPPIPHATDHKTKVRVVGTDGLSLGFNAAGDMVDTHLGAETVAAAESGGLFVRDVAADGPLIPLHGLTEKFRGGVRIMGEDKRLKLSYNLKFLPRDGTIWLDGELEDTSHVRRALTVYLAIPVQMTGWTWGDDIRQSESIAADREYTNQIHVTVGATSSLSLYPFGCVSRGSSGVAIGSQMDWPSIFRIFANGPNHQLVIGWDCSLPRVPTGWPQGTTRVRCCVYRLDPQTAAYGFRSAAQSFYRIMHPRFDRISHLDGIWIPFSEPNRVTHPEDFGFAFHEGDTSVKADDALGVLSFRYTEPMTYWMKMPPSTPRTYVDALNQLKAEAAGNDPKTRDWAQAVLNSGTEDAEGKFNVEFQNQPWANGAVWIMNVSPEIAATTTQPTRASIAYSLKDANKRYAPNQPTGDLDGEYLDSLEGWADYLDYRPLSLQTCPYPLPFDTDTLRPVIPLWYHVHSFARFLHDDLHNRGKLLMANTTPVRFTIFSSLLDLMGIEVNWLDGDHLTPDSDGTFNLRRTMSYRKPYLLLMNTDFNRFTHPMVEQYFRRCLFYGVFPSMFSLDAANSPYWENPAWYNRDRDLFKRYIPLIKRISAAGWEPVTYARTDNADVFVERWGRTMFTVMNNGKSDIDTTLTIQVGPLGLHATQFSDLISEKALPAPAQNGQEIRLSLHLAPGQVMELSGQ